MSLVFDSLVQRFLNVEQYADDLRYVNYCIKCVSLIKILCDSVIVVQPVVVVFTRIKHNCSLAVSCRRVIIRTPSRCTLTSTVMAWARGRPPSTRPGRSSLSRGGCTKKPRLCTRRRWRTEPSQPTPSSASTGNNTSVPSTGMVERSPTDESQNVQFQLSVE